MMNKVYNWAMSRELSFWIWLDIALWFVLISVLWLIVV